MFRLAADHNINEAILTGLEKREPDISIVRLFAVGLAAARDEQVLDWAAGEGRIVLTHDIKTLIPLAHARVAASLPMPGVILIPTWAPIGGIIDDLYLIIETSTPDEWVGQVVYLPLQRQ